MKFLHGLLSHFSRLKDDDITPSQYLSFAEELKKNKAEPSEIKQTFELANAFKVYSDLKSKNNVMDFSDLISNTLQLLRTRKHILKKYQDQFQYILVDEFQDTNYAQNEIAILLAGDKQNITVVADDDQCLTGNTLVTTPGGTKEISKIKVNDTITTAVGKGSLSFTKVKKVFKNKKGAVFITIKTKSGMRVTATHNHKMFCYTPKKVAVKKYYYVYLMYRKDLGWRLGTTTDLAVRLKLERSSDAIIGLRAFTTQQEARYHELLWSLTFQLPTCIFKERDGVMLQGELVQKLYRQIDTSTNAKRLTENLGIDLRNCHYSLDGVTRGQKKRIKVNVYQCYRNYAAKRKGSLLLKPSILHAVILETSNPNTIQQLQNHKIKYKKTAKGIRVRLYTSDLAKAHSFAENLAAITGGFTEAKSTIATLHKVNMPSVIMPMGNLLEGLYVPVIKNNRVYYDEIVSITRENKTDIVYDLEIDKTHNFIANNIVVHNSIYRWRGAAISNILQFRSHLPKTKVVSLISNYRSTQTILDSAYQMIQHNNPDRLEVKEKISKKLISAKNTDKKNDDPVELIYTGRADEEAEAVAKIIKEDAKKTNRQYNEYAILVRANDHSVPFQRSLERHKIPYQFLGPGHLFEQPEIKDLISYLHVLANFEDTPSLYRLLTMEIWDIEARDIAALLNFTKKSNCSLFETLEQVDNTNLTPNGKEKTKRIVAMLKKHLSKIPKDTAGQILYYFIEDSGLMGVYLDPRTLRTEREAQNIAKFFEKLQSYSANHDDSSVFAVADWIDLSMELGESPMAADVDWSINNAVNILTIHSSKGLEFPVVFVVNLVTQRFPSRDRKEQIPVPQDIIREELPQGDENLQEERRLFYVAMTRAKDKLVLTASQFYGEGRRARKLSPFVFEALGQKYVDSIIQKHSLQQNSQQLSLLDMVNENIKNEPSQLSDNTQFSQPNPLRDTNLTDDGTGGQETFKNPINYISYSQIQTFDVCPLHYKLRYILNFPSPASSALSFGTSVHNSLRDCFIRLLQSQPLTPSLITNILNKNWINAGYTSKNHEQKAIKHADNVLKHVMNKNLEEKPHTLAVEMPFQFWLNKIKVGGRIDRIDQLTNGQIEIIDYKTGTNIPDGKKLLSDMQLTFYALAASEIKDKILNKKPGEIKLSLYYVEADKKFTTTRSAEQLKEAKNFILDKVTEMRQSDFSCKGGNLCKVCEYKILCNTFLA